MQKVKIKRKKEIKGFMSKIIHATDSTFEQEVLQSKQPVLLDFWAPWCGPCRMVGAVLDELSSNSQFDNLKIVKIDIDENPQMATKFGVRSIPFLLLFKNGEVVDQQVGAIPYARMTEFVKKVI